MSVRQCGAPERWIRGNLDQERVRCQGYRTHVALQYLNWTSYLITLLFCLFWFFFYPKLIDKAETSHSSDLEYFPAFPSDCQSSGALQVLTSRCQGKKSCLVRASTREFGDPCYSGTRKYLSVIYTCGEFGPSPRGHRRATLAHLYWIPSPLYLRWTEK